MLLRITVLAFAISSILYAQAPGTAGTASNSLANQTALITNMLNAQGLIPDPDIYGFGRIPGMQNIQNSYQIHFNGSQFTVIIVAKWTSTYLGRAELDDNVTFVTGDLKDISPKLCHCLTASSDQSQGAVVLKTDKNIKTIHVDQTLAPGKENHSTQSSLTIWFAGQTERNSLLKMFQDAAYLAGATDN
jgi:hypothetical protein